MGKVYFLFGVHNHQPVGNHDFVFREAFSRCYKPFLDVLSGFSQVKCNIHISGPLFDWIMENEKGYIDTLKEMISKGQIEIIGGGYYEPILQTISDSDKLSQIRLMNDFIKKEFKAEPQGMWLAERIWEPYLARVINESGLKYTFLDDTHFRKAGLGGEELTGYYITEESSKPLAVFPISKTLRYKIPFSKPREAISILKSFRKKEDVLVTLFDDGEKFGLWPTTHEWVYEKKWLENFLRLLIKNRKYIETITAKDALAKFPSRGLIYLPNSSYIEMDEWVMEPEEYENYRYIKDYIKKDIKASTCKYLIQAGFFRNFFRKYSRLNYMHKKMLYLSENILKSASPEKDPEIFRNLWKAQCNCAYWHGLFGGFYLGHIRAAVYENLIKAEKKLDEKYGKNNLIVEKADFDFDGISETVVKNKHLVCTFSPRGGSLLELSLKDKNFNLLNTVTRKEESYHRNIKGKARNGIISDKYERLGFVDHLLGRKMTVNDFDKQRKFVTLANQVYDSSVVQNDGVVNLEYKYSGDLARFTKRIIFNIEAGLKLGYDFEKTGFLKKYNFGTEFNLFLQSSSDVKFFTEKGETPFAKTELKNLNSLRIVDNFKNIGLRFDFDRADVFVLPICTLSSSEKGLEKSCQEASILFVPRLKDKKSFHLSLRLDEGGKQ